MSTRAVAPTVAASVSVVAPLQRPMLQRSCDCGQHTSGGECEECKKKNGILQRQSRDPEKPTLAPEMVQDVLRSPGEPLDREIRDFFEPRFDHDFSQIRVHSSDYAARSARAVSAFAYTFGNHIVFGTGQYRPSSRIGRRLLGHELTHTIQQGGRNGDTSKGVEMGSAESSAEREAELAATNIDTGQPTGPTTTTPPTLQRQKADAKAGDHATRPEDFGITIEVVDHGAAGVREAASMRLQETFSNLSPDNLVELQKSGITRIEMHIVPYDKKLIDLPEFKLLKGTKTPDGRLWDDVRGAGSNRSGSTIQFAVAEEDLAGSRHGHGFAIGLGITGGLGFGAGGAALGVDIGKQAQHGRGPGGLIGGLIGGAVGAGLGALGGALLGNLADQPSPSYGPGFLATHEGSHDIEVFALTADQHKRLEAIFQSRKNAGGPWLEPTRYTSSNVHEYFAQGASAYFSRPYEDQYKASYTPEWLKRNDPEMYGLLNEVFGSRTHGQRNDMLEMRYRATAVA